MFTLQTYRQTLARALGGYEGRGDVATSGARVVTTTGTPASLIEARWPIQRGRIDSDFYQGALLYRTGVGAAESFPDFDRVRQIPIDGYDSENGKFIPDEDWMIAPVAGEQYEVHLHGFDPLRELTGFINEALRAIVLVVDVHFVMQTDARGAYVPEFDADGFALSSWLTAPEQILSVRSSAALGPLGMINGNDWMDAPGGYRGAGWTSGARLYLTAACGLPGASVWAQCYKPAFDHCRPAAGAYGALAGLTPGVEDDEALPSPEWVAAGATALAWESFDDMERGAQAVKAQRYQQAKASFYRRQQDYFLQHPTRKTYVPYGQLV